MATTQVILLDKMFHAEQFARTARISSQKGDDTIRNKSILDSKAEWSA